MPSSLFSLHARALALRVPDQLQRLVLLRWLEILSQLLVVGVAVSVLGMALPVVIMTSITLALLLVNLLTWWRLGRAWPVLPLEFFIQILVDVVALTGLLYLAGGSANPFVSLLLLPLTIAAIGLSAGYAWALAGVTVLAYTGLMFFHQPLPSPKADLPGQQWWMPLAVGAAGSGGHEAHRLGATTAQSAGGNDHADHGSQMAAEGEFCETGHSERLGVAGAASAPANANGDFALHLMGMWFNFLVSAGVVGFFLTRMAAALRARERELAAAREASLRNEQILALGTMAAGAAHQLGTPLSTLAVLLREMEMDHPHGPLAEDLALARQQVHHCKTTLTELLAHAGSARGESAGATHLTDWLNAMMDRWQLLRPSVNLDAHLDGPDVAVLAERSLEQALLNLLDNAADAAQESQESISLLAHWNQADCVIEIRDHGPGLDRETVERIGQPFISTKSGGLGIGLFLSNATLERFGGKVELHPHPNGGTLTRVTLPLAKLKLAQKSA